jgi:glyoxylase-like metal-dependent hydrolase (beta-lactamase superfamily II)
MQICSFPLGPLETNCFVIHTKNEALVMDPGGDPAPVLAYLQKHGLKLVHICNTHLHCDHTYGNAALQQATGAPILADPADLYLLDSPYGQGGARGLPPVAPFSPEPLAAGTTQFLGAPCQVLSTPGHTRGSLSFYWPDLATVFAGDVLFQSSVGRTDLPGGDAETLLDSIRRQLFVLPPDTVVYPGHGPSTSIGEELRYNPYVRG